MDLMDALKERGNPFWIPYARRADLPQLFVNLGFRNGVEIGVGSGGNLQLYCEAGLTMYGVDPWEPTEDYFYRPTPNGPGNIDGWNKAKEISARYTNCVLLRMTSLEAAKEFKDGSLDFVYIDGDHSFGHVAMDLMRWSARVKTGGIVAGHDYCASDRGLSPWRASLRKRNIRAVTHVVDAFVKTYEIHNWYVLGSKNEDRQPDEECDEFYSFFFIKTW